MVPKEPPQQNARQQGAGTLAQDVRHNQAKREATRRGETQRHGGVDVSTGEIAQRVNQGQDDQAER